MLSMLCSKSKPDTNINVARDKKNLSRPFVGHLLVHVNNVLTSSWKQNENFIYISYLNRDKI